MSQRDPKRRGYYLLPRETVEVVETEAKRRGCWPARVIEDAVAEYFSRRSKRRAASA